MQLRKPEQPSEQHAGSSPLPVLLLLLLSPAAAQQTNLAVISDMSAQGSHHVRRPRAYEECPHDSILWSQ
jgi:hypothetical protein